MNRALRTTSAVAFALALSACGGSDTPVAPPVQPTPAPTPSAAPSPVLTAGCNLPALPDLKNQCPRLTPELWEFVEAAIQKTIADHPTYFDFSEDLGGGAYKVLNRDGYIKSVVADIQAQGVCAREEIEEIQVKNSNAFNEQYNIWVSSGHVRHGPRSYITTCFPAQF